MRWRCIIPAALACALLFPGCVEAPDRTRERSFYVRGMDTPPSRLLPRRSEYKTRDAHPFAGGYDELEREVPSGFE